MPNKQRSPKEEVSRRKKKGSGKPQGDDIDSKGNIRNLIDYNYETSDSGDDTDDSWYPEEVIRNPVASRTRASTSSKLIQQLKKEKNRLKKRLVKNGGMHIDDTSDEEDRPKKKILKRRAVKQPVVEEEEEEDSSSSSESSSSSSEEEDEMELDEEEDEEDEDEDEDTEMESEEMPPGISISFGGMPDNAEKLIPKRHNMKKESADVKKFVKLLTQPSDENSIDCQIDQYKALPEEQKRKMIDVLERKTANPSANPTQSLMFKLMTMNLPVETQALVLSKYQSLQTLDPGSSEYFKQRNWLEKLTSLPLGIYKEMPVKIEDGHEKCNEFMKKARECLDDAIFGQDEAKLQVLQFIGANLANPTRNGLNLLLAGPPGIGKTSLIKNGIAKAMEWPFQFISLGGDSDASTYTGHQLVYESSHCGKIVNSLAAAKSMSMVLMFDEVDKISTTPKGEEVQHMLIHLTDPVQNGEFEDKYLAGINIDLSRAMFVFSANDLSKIDRVLLDRFVVIQLQGYTVKDKITIAEQYLLPAALKELGLHERIAIGKDIIPHILDNYANDEAGVRELKRCIEQVVQKINMLRLFNTADLPFHIKDFSLPFTLKKEHIDLFLKKKSNKDMSFMKMYS